MIQEKEVRTVSGIAVLVLAIAAILGTVVGFIMNIVALEAERGSVVLLIALLVALLVKHLALVGLFTVPPNEGVVLQLFGRYVGTVGDPGLRWTNPFYSKRKVSLRVRNFETGEAQGQRPRWQPDRDRRGRRLAGGRHRRGGLRGRQLRELRPRPERVGPAQPGHRLPLRRRTTTARCRCAATSDEIAEHLKVEIQERLAKAGVEVIEARISHLAYAPEIASAMLQRQQATAIIAARQMIVDGAVGMVEMALDQLAEHKVVISTRSARRPW